MYNLPQIARPTPTPARTITTPACKAIRRTASNIAPLGISGGFWHSTLMGDTGYNHVMPPNSWSCVYGSPDNNHPMGALPPSSRHPGVVNVLMLDSSVRSVKGTVSVPAWWAIGTMTARTSSPPISSDRRLDPSPLRPGGGRKGGAIKGGRQVDVLGVVPLLDVEGDRGIADRAVDLGQLRGLEADLVVADQGLDGVGAVLADRRRDERRRPPLDVGRVEDDLALGDRPL